MPKLPVDIKTQGVVDFFQAYRNLGAAIKAKDRQGINLAPTDDAHTVTHRPPEAPSPNADAPGQPGDLD